MSEESRTAIRHRFAQKLNETINLIEYYVERLEEFGSIDPAQLDTNELRESRKNLKKELETLKSEEAVVLSVGNRATVHNIFTKRLVQEFSHAIHLNELYEERLGEIRSLDPTKLSLEELREFRVNLEKR